ncbi:hypothetical protein CGL27_01905 [Streptomyces sp. 11-1-2]|nr:hypothetical protein CGL27_01905 [Streptomyces sp. 11-1-2]
MEVRGDTFVSLLTMLLGPIIFCVVVGAIATVANLSQVGKAALRPIVYFEVVTTIALILGLVVVNLVRPGDGRLRPIAPTWQRSPALGTLRGLHAGDVATVRNPRMYPATVSRWLSSRKCPPPGTRWISASGRSLAKARAPSGPKISSPAPQTARSGTWRSRK